MVIISPIKFNPTKLENISFTSSAPKNYKKIDEFVSRSAQPTEADLVWLKEQEKITDVFNFRTMLAPAIDFNEEEAVKKLGMKYHQLPLTEKLLNKGDEKEILPIVKTILERAKQIIKAGGKVHWHCKAGADRTGFISLLYKEENNIDTFEKNAQEMLDLGHNQTIYPNVISTAKKISKKLK